MDVLHKKSEADDGSDIAAYFAITSTVSVGCAPSMANVFALGGWAMCGVVGLFGVVTWYTGVLLLECIYAVPGKRLNSYAAAGEAAFGVSGRVVVQGFSNFSLLSFAALFIKFSAINFTQVSVWLGVDMTETAWAWISGGVVLVPYVAFRELKEVGIFSVLGLLTVLVTVIMGICLSLLSPIAKQLHRPLNWEGFPAALGTLCFMFGGNVIFTHVEAGMKNPRRWSLVLGLAMATVVVLYLLLGLVGYWVYGEEAINPVTQNFQQDYATSILVVVVSLHLLVDTVFQLISFSAELEAQVCLPPTGEEHRDALSSY
ncbi:hypothetical protein DSO57_1032422 [Entomophthora muscae]|uniref:Uncharacterized protein n=1 Tax=Entomophthora muscae TaxID=34485 RepID=A0ACC2SPR5_9FUNG|nr:hypothetical protein DSO57_1032422 [Entomophthora muscae]